MIRPLTGHARTTADTSLLWPTPLQQPSSQAAFGLMREMVLMMSARLPDLARFTLLSPDLLTAYA
jgi:hypothetical protein